MTKPSKQPIPPGLDAVWKTFVTNVQGVHPERTITTSHLRAAPQTKSIVAEQLPPPVTPSELPSVPISSADSTQHNGTGGDFEVTGVLGEGGMGRVLLARQRSLQRDVALKVIKPATSNRDVVDTLMAEAIITGSIEHPSIVPVHALGRDTDGLPVLVMKRIEGVSWRQLTQDHQHPVWDLLAADEGDRLDVHLEILMAVCNAVHYAHTRGIIHRDIKLENVMIGGFGEVYLVDWGIALRINDTVDDDPKKPESFSAPVGTLAYMAPEMAIGDLSLMDARTDVYLLGATLHFILTGKPRHQGEMLIEMLFSARDSEPVEYGPEVPAELAAICNKAMHVDQDKRFQSALEMRQALASFRRHRGSIALAERASARLSEVEAFLSEHGIPAEGSDDQRRLVKWMTESRFGFMQALAEWKGNHFARKGLDRCIERLIDYEIRQRSVGGARALLSELSEPRPELERRIDALAADFKDAREREQRLQALARDVDVRIGARVQSAVIAVIPIAAALSVVIMWQRGQGEVARQQLITFPLMLLAMLVGAFYLVRKQLTTAVSRRAFALLVVIPVAVIAHRALALAYGAPLPGIFSIDLVISAVVFVAMAVTILPALAWVACLLLAGAIAISQFPTRATPIFLGVAIIAAAIVATIWGRLSPRKDG